MTYFDVDMTYLEMDMVGDGRIKRERGRRSDPSASVADQPGLGRDG